jgi:hypothetical protein
MTKVPFTPEDLSRHLAEQIDFLENSCTNFDRGSEAEAKRLAVTMRVLFHDTQKSHSLLGQLDKLKGTFVDTAERPVLGALITHNSLAFTEMGPKARYVAMLDRVEGRDVSFDEWWNGVIFIDERQRRISRSYLVLRAANQDGGAHVAPGLDEEYADLTRNNSLGWTKADIDGEGPMSGPEKAAMRQIAHEALKSIKPGYSCNPSQPAGPIYGNISVSHAPPPHIAAIHFKGPNGTRTPADAQCPCGSGRPYRGCHDKS